MVTMGTHYYFIPYLRTGLAAKLQQNPPAESERAALDITLTLNAGQPSGGIDEKRVSKSIQLYGPGDVASFNKQIVVDHNPRDQIGDFEPNYFPTIQFRDPDFPWRFNAGIANGNDLLPWLTLVVLVAEDSPGGKREFTKPARTIATSRAEKRQLSYIEEVNTSNLPDLNEVWRWAHVQITSSEEIADLDGDSGRKDKIFEIMEEYPERITSRLVCARRLRPGILYNAFVVPTFKLGLAPAGLLPSKEGVSALDLAWDSNSNETIRLPYYYHWEFRTGERGDFEHLVRQLKARELTEVGLRDMECSTPGLGVSGVSRSNVDPERAGILELEGSVQSLDTVPTYWGRDRGVSYQQPETLQDELSTLLNRNNERLSENVIELPDVEASFVIIGVTLTIGSDTLIFAWSTSEDTTALVRYGIGDLGEYIEVIDQQKDHALLIEGLEPGATYLLRLGALSQGGQLVETEIVEFTTEEEIPQVLPPVYGRWHAGRDRVNSNVPPGNWLDELNLDPRHRAAAGAGAEVIRRQQEALMASAWEQVGEVDQANAMLNRAQLGKEICGNFFQRMLDLPDDDFFSHTTPLHARMKETTANTSFAKIIRDSRVPEAAFNSSLRRIRRPHGAIHKRQVRAKGETDLLKERNLIQRFNGELDYSTERLFTAAGETTKPRGTVDLLQVSTHFEQSVAAAPVDSGLIATAPLAVASTGVVATMLNFSSSALNSQLEEGVITGRTDKKVAGALSPMLDGIFKMQEEVPDPAYRLDIPSLRSRVEDKLDPKATLNNRLRARLQIAGQDEEKDLPDIIMAAPEFSQPMYKPLGEISQEWVVPGIENIPQNTIGLLIPNSRFIEAFLCGCNHEFAAELLWREYPTDQRGTYFRQFWQPISSPQQFMEVRRELENLVDFLALNSEIMKEKRIESTLKERGVFEEQKDISPIHGWIGDRLGGNAETPVVPGEENLVLIIRGDLLKKYPNAVIYAVEGVKVLQFGQEFVKPGLEEFLRGYGVNPIDPRYPIFSANVPPDITLLGFDIEVSNAVNNEWFFVIEERVSETRFGLDVPSGEVLSTMDDFNKNLAWDHFLGVGENTFGKYLNALFPSENVIANANEIDDAQGSWQGSGSASIGVMTFQKPARIVVSSDKMIPKVIRDRYS